MISILQSFYYSLLRTHNQRNRIRQRAYSMLILQWIKLHLHRKASSICRFGKRVEDDWTVVAHYVFCLFMGFFPLFGISKCRQCFAKRMSHFLQKRLDSVRYLLLVASVRNVHPCTCPGCCHRRKPLRCRS